MSLTGHTILREYLHLWDFLQLSFLAASELFSPFPRYDQCMAFNAEAPSFPGISLQTTDAYPVKAVQDCIRFFFPE